MVCLIVTLVFRDVRISEVDDLLPEEEIQDIHQQILNDTDTLLDE